MGIFKPKPMLSKNEVRLFRLIFELLETETVKSAYPSNYSGDYIPVSQKDTGKLDVLIKGLIEDRKFQEKLYLCENITSINNANELKLNKVYRIGRRLEGKAASFPSIEWHDLLKRIGVKVRYQALAYAQEMSFSYFLKMELKLLLYSDSLRMRKVLA